MTWNCSLIICAQGHMMPFANYPFWFWMYRQTSFFPQTTWDYNALPGDIILAADHDKFIWLMRSIRGAQQSSLKPRAGDRWFHLLVVCSDNLLSTFNLSMIKLIHHHWWAEKNPTAKDFPEATAKHHYVVTVCTVQDFMWLCTVSLIFHFTQFPLESTAQAYQSVFLWCGHGIMIACL